MCEILFLGAVITLLTMADLVQLKSNLHTVRI